MRNLNWCLSLFLRTQESCSTIQTGPPSTGASHIQPPGQIQRPAHAKEYSFLDIELRYGLLQVKFMAAVPLRIGKFAMETP